MTRDELEFVIANFEEAIRKKKMPTWGKNLHRVEQVLRILKVDLSNFRENENNRASIHRHLWDVPETEI